MKNIVKVLASANKDFLPYALKYFDNLKGYSEEYIITRKSGLNAASRSGLIGKFGNINRKNIVKLNDYLIAKEHKTTYIKSIFFALRIVFRDAEKNSLIYKNPLENYKIKAGKKSDDVLPLSAKSLQIIESAEFSTVKLQFCTDLFVFTCHTGLSYKDLTLCEYGQVVDIDNRTWLVGERSKTDVMFQIPLDEKAISIVDKYKNPPESLRYKKVFDERLFPYINRVSYEQTLKTIGRKTAIQEAAHLSPHKGRHTFATRMLEKGVSVESIRAMLGHSYKSKCVWLYALVTKIKILREVNQ
jgi:site-specific recombinase XerD